MKLDLPLVAEQFSEVTLDRVREAHDRIRDQVHQTPVHTSRQLNERVGAEVFLKLESFQRTGSFKFRGASNAIALLTPEEKKRGVLTFSSGNHGAALALAGREAGVKVTVVTPHDGPPVKRQAIAAYGAEIIEFQAGVESREELGAQLARDRGLTIVPPYDHLHVIAGAGTVALELLEQIPELDCIFACLGGGGLAAGTALVARDWPREVAVIGCEPAAANRATQSLAAGAIVPIPFPKTIADGARAPYLGERTFPIIRDHIARIIEVSESGILEASQFAAERLKLVVEPTGVLGLAGLFAEAAGYRGQRIGVIVSGGNTPWRPPVGIAATSEVKA